jgi:hypothetical protein
MISKTIQIEMGEIHVYITFWFEHAFDSKIYKFWKYVLNKSYLVLGDN